MEKLSNQFYHKGIKYEPHSNLSLNESAFLRIRKDSIFLSFSLVYLYVALLIVNWQVTLVWTVGILSFLYFADLLFNLFLIIRSFSKAPEIKISDEELEQAEKKDWPTYTVLCPLYKEWKVLPQFIEAMSALDYPKDKLQVILLFEEDDKPTIDKVKEFLVPKFFKAALVPHSLPKTKPKALNYGMQFATGDYVVVYDAEDIPDRDQLKKSVLAFKKTEEKVVCMQAKLNFYNPRQNLLTRIFTAEYSLWFDLVLTGLQSIHAPIPLGGTSNHFRTKDLLALKGWDSFNVTEDADLGMRLAKSGYRTAIVDSTTHEEANSEYRNWLNQRTRWIKGYIQTYFVHMRRSRYTLGHPNMFHLLIVQFVIGFKILSTIINPIMWVMTLMYFMFYGFASDFIEILFQTPILYIAVISLFVGNFLYIYFYILGCVKKEKWEIIPFTLFVPIYWLGMSISSFFAYAEFLLRPFHWHKTQHGLHLAKENHLRLTSNVITHVFRNPLLNIFFTKLQMIRIPNVLQYISRFSAVLRNETSRFRITFMDRILLNSK